MEVAAGFQKCSLWCKNWPPGGSRDHREEALHTPGGVCSRSSSTCFAYYCLPISTLLLILTNLCSCQSCYQTAFLGICLQLAAKWKKSLKSRISLAPFPVQPCVLSRAEPKSAEFRSPWSQSPAHTAVHHSWTVVTVAPYSKCAAPACIL